MGLPAEKFGMLDYCSPTCLTHDVSLRRSRAADEEGIVKKKVNQHLSLSLSHCSSQPSSEDDEDDVDGLIVDPIADLS